MALALAAWLVHGASGYALVSRGDTGGAGLEGGDSSAGLAQRQALQEEIRRSVQALAPIEAAQVLLTPAGAGPAGASHGAASVVLRLRAGSSLDEEQLQGIRQLVASGAGSLAPADVSVLDEAGHLLAAGAAAGDSREAVRESELERELAARAESLLAHTVGAGRVAVRVRAELDRSQREETRERFDPDGQVQRLEERTRDAGGGARASGRTTERVEYDVGKETSRAVTPAGAVKRLQVAVLVDGKPGAPGFTPWSPAELAQLEALVRQAVGLQADRGDALTLTNAPFRRTEPARFGLATRAWIVEALGYGAILAVIAVLAWWLLGLRASDAGVAGLPMSTAALEALLLSGGGDGAAALAQGGAHRVLPEEIAARASRDRDAGAAALRAWLDER